MSVIRPAAVLALAAALPAQAAWSMLYPPQSPPGRIDAVMAGFDASGHIVLFGCSGLAAALGGMRERTLLLA